MDLDWEYLDVIHTPQECVGENGHPCWISEKINDLSAEIKKGSAAEEKKNILKK